MNKFNCKDFGMFLLRVVVGVTFMIHGWDKIQNMDGVIGFFGSLGLPVIVAYLVAWVEFLGGIGVVLGLTRRCYALYALAVIMLGAMFLVKFSKGFSGGYEFDLVLFVALLALAWYGDMPWSVSSFLKKKEQPLVQ